METETQLVEEDPIALNAKKVAMALDDLIKLSKSDTKGGNKRKNSRRAKSKNRNFNGVARRNNTSKEKHHVNSLSGVRQGAVAKRMSNFKGNQFPVTTNVAPEAATVPPLRVRRRGFNAGRKNSANQSRLLAPPVQNRHARFIAKRQEVEQKVENGGGTWKTLDSRFAIMKEQRRSSNNNNNGVKEVHVPRLPPWARARRFTY